MSKVWKEALVFGALAAGLWILKALAEILEDGFDDN